MALLGIRTRDLCKIALIAVLVTLAGVPVQGEPEAQADEKKVPSAKECRAHIDAALEQYWDTAQPSVDDQQTSPTKTPETEIREDSNRHSPDETDDDEEDEDEDDPPVKNSTEDEAEGKETQMEDELKTSSDNDGSESADEIAEDDDDDDDDEVDDDDEADESDDEIDNGEEDDDIIEEEQEGEAEEDKVTDSGDKVSHAEDKKDNESAEEKKGSESAEDQGDDDENEVAENDGDDDDDDENDDDDDDEIMNGNAEVPTNQTLESGKENADDQSEDEEDEEEEDDDDLNEEEESVIPSTESTEDIVKDEPIDATESPVGVDSNKATGESDSADVGVAQELSDPQPATEQPQIAKDAEKTSLNLTSSEKDAGLAVGVGENDEDDDDDDDDDDDEDEIEDLDMDDDDEMIENIYEEEDEEEDYTVKLGEPFRSRDHIDAILGLDDIGTQYDQEEEKLAQSIFKEIKKIQVTNVKPMEMLYKYAESTTRRLGDAEIFSKPMVLFLGPWNTGKSTIINYLLGLERTPEALKIGTGITDVDFTILTHGEKRQVISGTELAADWAYAGVQRFGQGFLEHFRAITIPHTLLKKITIVDTPGILENKKNAARGYAFNDAFQWFIDRSDAIYVVLDPTKVDVGLELSSVLDQLKGRDVRFILNKADTIRRSDLMRVVGQLFWNLSPLMSSTEAPVIYAASLSTKPYHPSAPAKFLADQEKNFLYDFRETMDKRIENKILYARRHAVRVRNHAKMIDCYLSTYYTHKSIFSSKKNVAKLITDNPKEYKIYEGLSSMTNVSRYDLPDPSSYREFFSVHPLYDFKPLASTCSYFRGCPMDQLDLAITSELPELFAKYKKAKVSSTLSPPKQDGR